MDTRTCWRPVSLVLGIGILLCAVACGGGSDSAPTTPTIVAPTPRLVTQGNFTLRAPDEDSMYFGVVPITDGTSGLWEATVDWAIPTNTLWMWVANGSCSASQFARADCPYEATCPCQFAVRSEVATSKPRVLTIPNAPGGTRTLIVMNLGPREESGTYRVMLTPSSLVANSMSSAVPLASPVTVGQKKAVRR